MKRISPNKHFDITIKHDREDFHYIPNAFPIIINVGTVFLTNNTNRLYNTLDIKNIIDDKLLKNISYSIPLNILEKYFIGLIQVKNNNIMLTFEKPDHNLENILTHTSVKKNNFNRFYFHGVSHGLFSFYTILKYHNIRNISRLPIKLNDNLLLSRKYIYFENDNFSICNRNFFGTYFNNLFRNNLS